VSLTEPRVPPPLVYVGVVDDNTFYRDWLGQAGTLPPHHHVVARAADAGQLASVLTELPDGRCDVILLDLRIAPGPGVDPVHSGGPTGVPVQGRGAVELLLRVADAAVTAGHLARVPAILVYTQELAPRVHVACLIAGAAGVVLKAEPLNRLGQAIDIVAAGGLVVDEAMATLIELLANQHRLDLTDTESAVLALAGHGLTRHQISRRLSCAESTVDKHLRAIRDKFGNDVHLTDLADAFGLRDLAPPEPTRTPVRRDRLRTLARRLTS
jgi:DNA-binding NarL/FixJ family response regulator